MDIKQIVKRMKSAANCKTDTELAHYLGIKQTTISIWKSKHRVPYKEILKIAQRTGASMDSILLNQAHAIMNIHHRIKLARETLGLTQTKLAEVLGVSKASVNQWEKTQVSLQVDTISKLSRALSVSFVWLRTGTDYQISLKEEKILMLLKDIPATKQQALLDFLTPNHINPRGTNNA